MKLRVYSIITNFYCAGQRNLQAEFKERKDSRNNLERKHANKEKEWVVERQKYEEKTEILDKLLKIKVKQIVDHACCYHEEIELK